MKYSLQQISDRLEIEDLIVEYADAIDTQAFDRLDQVFMPDAFIDYTAMAGPKGQYPEVKQFLRDSLPAFKNTQHMLGNYQIKLDKADDCRATGKIMCFNPMELDLGPVQPNNIFFLGLWYVDEYVKHQGQWRISKRMEIKSYDFNTPDYIQFPDN
ncbi:MAG: nuclear transport factor 2 family protein [Pseudomonadales bacterium]|nr:nuclear transport factor 2 family protein [Pseudomonadales bacterium]